MKWTSKKEEYLKNNWETQSDDELAEKIGTTKDAIIAKRRRLNLIRKHKELKNTRIYSYDEVNQLFKNKNYTLLDTEYKNYTTKMHYICNKHSEHGEQKINLSDLLRNRGCYYCGRERTMKNKKFDASHWKKECEKQDFTFVDFYAIDGITHIKYICNKHKEYGIQEKYGGTIGRSSGCPYCKQFFHENLIATILDKWGINFVTQKRFPDCKDKNTLPFDYYIGDFNIAIEYDGEFHYHAITRGGTIPIEKSHELLRNTQKRDLIKTEYCEEHNIHLIRIPYWDQIYIEDILFDKLVEYGALVEE